MKGTLPQEPLFINRLTDTIILIFKNDFHVLEDIFTEDKKYALHITHLKLRSNHKSTF